MENSSATGVVLRGSYPAFMGKVDRFSFAVDADFTLFVQPHKHPTFSKVLQSARTPPSLHVHIFSGGRILLLQNGRRSKVDSEGEVLLRPGGQQMKMSGTKYLSLCFPFKRTDQ